MGGERREKQVDVLKCTLVLVADIEIEMIMVNRTRGD